MTEGRKSFVRTALVSLLFSTAMTTDASSLNELIAKQEAALSTLESTLLGRSPYVQVRTTHDAMGVVRQSSEDIARESRKLEHQRAALAEENQQLLSTKGTLQQDVQRLTISTTNLLTDNENLASERNRLIAQNEHLVSGQSFFSMAFYTALVLAFLGFGGLLVRIPGSRLDLQLKRLEIAELENKLKKEASMPQGQDIEPQPGRRPMAGLMSEDIRQSQSEPLRAHAKRIRPGSRDARKTRVPKEQFVAVDEKVREKKAETTTTAPQPDTGEQDARRGETKQKQKKKKKMGRALRAAAS